MLKRVEERFKNSSYLNMKEVNLVGFPWRVG